MSLLPMGPFAYFMAYNHHIYNTDKGLLEGPLRVINCSFRNRLARFERRRKR